MEVQQIILLALLKNMKKTYQYWVSEEDNGISEAYNKGFRVANGGVFIDAKR